MIFEIAHGDDFKSDCIIQLSLPYPTPTIDHIPDSSPATSVPPAEPAPVLADTVPRAGPSVVCNYDLLPGNLSEKRSR